MSIQHKQLEMNLLYVGQHIYKYIKEICNNITQSLTEEHHHSCTSNPSYSFHIACTTIIHIDVCAHQPICPICASFEDNAQPAVATGMQLCLRAPASEL